MSSLLFYLFIVSFSVHACSGRFLGIDLDKRITRESLFSEISRQLPEPRGNHHQVGGERLLIRITRILPRNLLALLKKVGGSETATLGNYKALLVSSQTEMQLAAEQERAEKKGRSLQGSASDDTEETVGPSERDAPEDAVVMDYAQPHRKPPIHNENF